MSFSLNMTYRQFNPHTRSERQIKDCDPGTSARSGNCSSAPAKPTVRKSVKTTASQITRGYCQKYLAMLPRSTSGSPVGWPGRSALDCNLSKGDERHWSSISRIRIHVPSQVPTTSAHHHWPELPHGTLP